MTIYLVSDESNCLVNILPSLEAAEKFVMNHGLDSWTIEEEEAC